MLLYEYGKILDVDLSTEKMVKRDIDPQICPGISGRTEITTKSPLTGNIGTGNTTEP